VAGIATSPHPSRRATLSKTTQTVSASAEIVRSHTSPVVEALTYQASISPESPVPVAVM